MPKVSLLATLVQMNRINHFLNNTNKQLVIIAIAIMLTNNSYAQSNVTEGQDKATGLRHWQWQNGQVQIRLTQRLPDQTRGYFLARGFDLKHADQLATNCTFQTLFKNNANEGQSSVTINMKQWRTIVDGKSKPLLLREDWQQRWKNSTASAAAMIALRWSLMPSQQTYHPTDYNWGMTSFGLKPTTQFNLSFSWDVNHKTYTGIINNIVCPADK